MRGAYAAEVALNGGVRNLVRHGGPDCTFCELLAGRFS